MNLNRFIIDFHFDISFIHLPFQEEIKHVTVPMLNRLIARDHNLAVVFMDETSSEGKKVFKKNSNSVD